MHHFAILIILLVFIVYAKNLCCHLIFDLLLYIMFLLILLHAHLLPPLLFPYIYFSGQLKTPLISLPLLVYFFSFPESDFLSSTNFTLDQ